MTPAFYARAERLAKTINEYWMSRGFMPAVTLVDEGITVSLRSNTVNGLPPRNPDVPAHTIPRTKQVRTIPASKLKVATNG